MPDEIPVQDTPVESEDQSQADDPRPDPTPAVESMSLEEARKLRSESASLRKRLKALEDEKLSETERLKRDHEAITAERDQLRTEARQLRAVSTAQAAGAKYPQAVARLLAESAYEDEKTLGRAITDLRRDYPDLFFRQNGSADAGEGRQALPTDDMNARLRRATGR